MTTTFVSQTKKPNPLHRKLLPRLSMILGASAAALVFAAPTQAVAQAASANFRGAQTQCTGPNEVPITTSYTGGGGSVWRESNSSGLEGTVYTYTFSPPVAPGRFVALWFDNVAGWSNPGRNGVHGNFTVTYSDSTTTSNMVPAISGNLYGFNQSAISTQPLINRTGQIGGTGPVFNGVVHGNIAGGSAAGNRQAAGTMEFSAIDPTKPVQSISWTVLEPGPSGRNAFSSVRATCAYVPVVQNDVATSATVGPVTVNPLANDSDIDSSLDPASVVLTGAGAPGTATLSADMKTLTVPGEGVWRVNPTTGATTFTPERGVTAAPTPAAYTVSDTEGNTSAPATVTVSFAVSSAPPGSPILAVSDSLSTVDLATGGTTASVLDNDRLNGTLITSPAQVTLTPGLAPTPPMGAITMNPDGTISVAPGTTAGTYVYGYEICEITNPTSCATTTAAVVVATSALLDEIDEDLVSILQDDRAATMTQLSQQMSGFASEAGDRVRDRAGAQCLANVNDLLVQSPILFDSDRAVIKPGSARVLDQIAETLAGCPGQGVEIAGHTDSDASDAYNLALSQRRVDAVLRALTARGVATEGFVARGYGERRPIASNATPAGKARNRRVVFVALEGDYVAPCEADQLVRALDLEAGDDGVDLEGRYLSDRHDCARDGRKVVEAELSYLETDEGQAQTMLNLSYRQERFRDADSLRGYFLGFYLTQNDINQQATGEIRGVGVSGGIYGAEGFESGLVLDYYLGAAMGVHDFDLAFQRASGAVLAAGDYTYFAGFAGAALSGELEVGRKTVTPRVGVDYMYSPSTEANIGALNGTGVSEALDLPSLSGGRIFAELGTEWDVDGGDARLGVTPRIACYQSIGSLGGACGFGGTISLASTGEETGLIYLLELDAERGDGYSRAAISGSIARELRAGRVRGTAEVGESGVTRIGGQYELAF